MRAVTWRAVPAEFKTGICEMKFKGLGFCGVFLECHENEVLNFMSATLGYQERQAKVFIGCVCTSYTIFIEGF